MTSIKARILNSFIRNGHLLRGKLHKDVFDMNTSIEGFRERCEKGAERFARVPEGILAEKEVISGLQAEWLIPRDNKKDKVILYIHGGGYVSGSCNDHRGYVAKFAQMTGTACLIYEYRLAPENPFPAAVDDSLTVYEYLLAKGYKSKDILFAGESAGGGLALALLLALKEKTLPLPCAAVAISPWTDLACTGDSYRTKNRLSPAPLDSWTVFSKHYCADEDPRNPLLSPLYGVLSGLPPLFISAAENDELYDDGELFSIKAGEAGVDVNFRKGTGMIHCYPLLAPLFPEATEAMEEIVAFIKKQFEEESVS